MHRYLVLAALTLGPTALAQTNAAACNLRGTSPASGAINSVGRHADENFFFVTGGPPNVMFLLDNSGSMNELPVEPGAASTRAAGTGCANSIYDSILASKGFDQVAGNYPPTDLGVAPCPGANCWNGDTGFPDLFLQTSFYRYRAWSRATATVYTAATACSGTSNSAACQTCVTTKGYYLDPSSTSDSRQIFSGKFLNVIPPKFVAARTVLKEVLWDVKRIRMGLTIFDSGNVGGVLTDALNPPCDLSLDENNAAWDNNRKSLINRVNGIDYVTNTPLAETLFNIGQYYTSDSSIYQGWFGTGWTKTSFNNGSLNGQNRSVCWGCQVSSVIVITDGAPCSDNCVPQCIKNQNVTCAGCDQQDCGCNGTCPSRCGSGSCTNPGSSGCCSGTQPNYLDDVAKWLYEHDLQTKNPTNGSWSSDGVQRLLTYTVGFALDHPLLRRAAEVGGGQYYVANDAASLKDSIMKAIDDVNRRATSFGVSSISTLQTASGISTLVPRFQPGVPGEHWRGYLYRFSVASELVNGCQPNNAQDLDGDGACESLFYVDADNDIVEEDAVTGLFVKRNTSTPARSVWEVGQRLNLLAPASRNLWTAIDRNGDGKLDGRDDPVLAFTRTNAALLKPYLGISDNVTNDPVCSALYDTLGITSPPKSAWGTACAEVIIDWYRGFDSMNADPLLRGNPRAWRMLDIFHSSPIVVDPPIPAEACDFFRGQCVASLYRHAGKSDNTAFDAYKTYVQNNERRRGLVLVGSNGGFLHAFDWGLPVSPEVRDQFTNRLRYDNGTGDERWGFLPPDLLGSLKRGLSGHTYMVDGTAMVRDIWVDDDTAFDGLAGGNGVKEAGDYRTVAIVGERNGGQHFFALDLTDTEAASPKFLWLWPQPGDATNALMGETWSNFFPKPPPIGPVLFDATSPIFAGASNPIDFKYKKYDGTTFVDMSKNSVERWIVMLNGGYDRSYVRGRGFAMLDAYTGHPFWEEFFDPTVTSPPRNMLEYPVAAGIAMLDNGPGTSLPAIGDRYDLYFDTANFGDLGGNLWVARMYEPGYVDGTTNKVTNWTYGRAFQTQKAANNQLNRRSISYITANAVIDLPPSLRHLGITVPNTPNGHVRTFFGTGDRNALLDADGGVCELDNLGACIHMGCTVQSTYEMQNLTGSEAVRVRTLWVDGGIALKQRTTIPCYDQVCLDTWESGCDNLCTATSCGGTSPCPACAGAAACRAAGYTSLLCQRSCAGACGDSVVRAEALVGRCPAGVAFNPTNLERRTDFQCVQGDAGLDCTRDVERSVIGEMPYASTANIAKHAFYSVHLFGPGADGGRVFDDSTTVAAYDTGRLTETDLGFIGSLSDAGYSLRPRGYYVTYDHVSERTASPATLATSQDQVNLCALWNTMTPAAALGGAVCNSGTGSQATKLVQGEAISGAVPCALAFNFGDGGTSRYISSTALVPPPEPAIVRSISATGEITEGAFTAMPGAPPRLLQTSAQSDVVQSIYQLELTPAEHVCRHRTGGQACRR